jgi:hypothetical protein
MSSRPNFRSDFPSVLHTSMTICADKAMEYFRLPVPQIAIEGKPYEITAVLMKKEWNDTLSDFAFRGEMQLKPWETCR